MKKFVAILMVLVVSMMTVSAMAEVDKLAILDEESSKWEVTSLCLMYGSSCAYVYLHDEVNHHVEMICHDPLAENPEAVMRVYVGDDEEPVFETTYTEDNAEQVVIDVFWDIYTGVL